MEVVNARLGSDSEEWRIKKVLDWETPLSGHRPSSCGTLKCVAVEESFRFINQTMSHSPRNSRNRDVIARYKGKGVFPVEISRLPREATSGAGQGGGKKKARYSQGAVGGRAAPGLPRNAEDRDRLSVTGVEAATPPVHPEAQGSERRFNRVQERQWKGSQSHPHGNQQGLLLAARTLLTKR